MLINTFPLCSRALEFMPVHTKALLIARLLGKIHIFAR